VLPPCSARSRRPTSPAALDVRIVEQLLEFAGDESGRVFPARYTAADSQERTMASALSG